MERDPEPKTEPIQVQENTKQRESTPNEDNNNIKPVENPPVQPSTLMVYYLRHAYSAWNKYCRENEKRNPMIKKMNIAEPRFMDPEITPGKGLEDVQRMQKIIRPYIGKIKVVFVSPMVRTIMTCDKLFKDLPGHETIKYILHPLLMPRIGHITDISCRYREYISDCADISFDTSMMKEYAEGRHWQTDVIDKYMPEYASKSTRDAVRDIGKIMCREEVALGRRFERLARRMDGEIEDNTMLRNRLKGLCAFLRQYAKDNNLSDGEICLISHNGVLNGLFHSRNGNCEIQKGYIWAEGVDRPIKLSKKESRLMMAEDTHPSQPNNKHSDDEEGMEG